MMEHSNTRHIPGMDERYHADEHGNIISFMRKSPAKLSPGLGSSGLYHTVSVLLEDGRRTCRNVHRLVCLAFHGVPTDTKMQASHLNGNSHDNRPANLMWETPLDNLNRKKLHGTHDTGTYNSRAHLKPADLVRIRELLGEGLTRKAIADILGVRAATVARAITGDRYKGQISEG